MTVEIGNILAGVDIGTSKVCAIIGMVTPEGLNVIGAGSAPSKGIQKGIITNLDAASDCIKKALDTAEVMANCKISSIIVNITGNHIQGINSNGVAPVKSAEINDEDVARVLESAKAVAIPPDREFLHVLAQEYILDGQEGIRNPKGMSGVRLEAHVHIVTGAINVAQNVIRCVNHCDKEAADMVLSALASGAAVLHEDEKELGCALVDIGSGVCDIAIWSHGALMHTHVLSVGGNHLTSDIAKGLQISLTDAEKLKIHYGCAMASAVGADDYIFVPSTDGREPRKLQRQVLAEIIEPRLEEIFEMINKEIEKSGYKEKIASGLVITGGAVMMDAVPELAERVLGLPVRRGVPHGIGGLSDLTQNPQYSTSVGLLLHEMNHPDIATLSMQDAKKTTLMGRFLEWIKQII